MGKVLIVDDDPHIRELVSMVLRNAGFEIIEAGTTTPKRTRSLSPSTAA